MTVNLLKHFEAAISWEALNPISIPLLQTINLKDFKAMLSLCEALGTGVRLWFDGPGNPLVAEPCFPDSMHDQVGAGCCAVLCCAVLCCAVLCCAMLCC